MIDGPSRFVRRPIEVEAMRIESGGWYRAFGWLEALHARATMTIDTDNPEDDVIDVEVAGGYRASAYTGDWLVRVGDRLLVLSHDDFTAEYAIIER